MSFAPATHIGPYEAQALTGGGGMGEVYRARDTPFRQSQGPGSAEPFVPRGPRHLQHIVAVCHPLQADQETSNVIFVDNFR